MLIHTAYTLFNQIHFDVVTENQNSQGRLYSKLRYFQGYLITFKLITGFFREYFLLLL